ncbi:MAG: acetate--CoA ligase family protein, partial [Proteobacteria bacterium]|nr:acetate--CoA ligase family protein [Pseudomonadota bacterium]
GEEKANREVLKKTLKAIGQIGLDFPEVAEIDINPLIIRRDGNPVAVDALVTLAPRVK